MGVFLFWNSMVKGTRNYQGVKKKMGCCYQQKQRAVTFCSFRTLDSSHIKHQWDGGGRECPWVKSLTLSLLPVVSVLPGLLDVCDSLKRKHSDNLLLVKRSFSLKR